MFGEKSFNKTLGIFTSVNQMGYALGAPIINSLFDITGSYKLALLLCSGVMLGIVITLQFIINSSQALKKEVANANA